MMLPVAILAGGLATRLRPITETIPKSLVSVAGRPFIEWQLEWLAGQGVQRVTLCVGHLGEEVEQAIGKGAKFRLDVSYSYDGDKLLGTGGALRRALPLLGDAFFVLYGDSFLTCNLAVLEAAFRRFDKPAMMTVYRNEGRWDTSNVIFTEGEIKLYDKKRPSADMQYIDYGLGALTKKALEAHREDQPFDLADIYTELSKGRMLAGYEVKDRFYEIGSFIGLQEAEQFFRGVAVGYAEQHLKEAVEILGKIDVKKVEAMADLLSGVKERGGRLFFLGVGGSAGNCSHAVNDFRKIVGIESYAPTDNVSELTARTNDEGWPTIFVEWLKTSRLRKDDAIFIFSVGGGSLEKNISPNLVEAIKYAKTVGAKVTGVVGRDGGYTAQAADACVIVPTVNSETITPHSEAFQAVIWHLLVSHPKLKASQTKWESASRP